MFNLRGNEGQTVLVKIPILAVEIVDGPPQKELVTSGESLPKMGAFFVHISGLRYLFLALQQYYKVFKVWVRHL